MPWSLTSGFLWNRWRGKRSRHSRRMRNPQFYVSGKRPIKHVIRRNESYDVHKKKCLEFHKRAFYLLQWNLYNETGEVLLKHINFVICSGPVFTKSCLFSLPTVPWKTICLERPQSSAVALYGFHCETKINRVLLKKWGGCIGPQNRRFRLKRGCFFRSESAKRGVFFNLGYEHGCTLWSGGAESWCDLVLRLGIGNTVSHVYTRGRWM